MKVSVPKETVGGERRVALVPDVVKRLTAAEVDVVVESGAGEAAHALDSAYEEAGATVTSDPAEAWGGDVVAKVRAPSAEEVGRLSRGQVVIGFLAPLTSPETTNGLNSAGVTSFAMEAIPRITRAQAMDALSSQATVAGYRAVLTAGTLSGRLYPMLMTAAGTIAPAKVLVLGAGVAGLQAIATARRLGAVVTGFDVRTVVKEQIESLGGKFLEVQVVADAEAEGGYARQLTDEEQVELRKALAEAAAGQDVIITTAQIPGKPAPLLINADAVRAMKAGSVIIDLAGESGGNCELSEAGETIVREDVTIAAPLNLPGEMAEHASQLYSKNVQNLIELMVSEDGALQLDFDDDIIAGACITHEGEIRHEGAKAAAGAAA